MNTAALVLVDFQRDYFPGGRFALAGMPAAAAKAGRLLQHFRKSNQAVFHVRHIETEAAAPFLAAGTIGIEIHEPLRPKEGEGLIEKHFPNAFRDTNLLELLRKAGAASVVICGAMSNMCIDATVRAAFDYGFECIVIEDACAAAQLEFCGLTVEARQVHAAFMGALASAYAQVVSLEGFLGQGA